MLEYETFCYLQNHKTGCTFVEEFIRGFTTETLRQYNKHLAPDVRAPDKFYFVNVREPVDTYLSLFNFGLDGQGEVRRRLELAKLDYLYRPRDVYAFDEWLIRMLNRRFSSKIYPELASFLADNGLVSMRFLHLATFNFSQPEPAVDRVLKYETLRNDLTAVVKDDLAHAITDLPGALEWISGTPPINTSRRREKTDRFVLRRRTVDALLARERVMYERFYPLAGHFLTAIARGGGDMFGNLRIVDS